MTTQPGREAACTLALPVPETRALRVLLVDDEPLYLECLEALVGSDQRLDVVGTAYDGAEAVRLAEALQPDLVLMDLDMPRVDGIDATARIRRLLPSVQVVIVTGSDSPQDAARACLAGAVGYLTKDVLGPDFADMIAELAA